MADMKEQFTGFFDNCFQWGQPQQCELISKFLVNEMSKDNSSFGVDHDLLIDALINKLKKEIFCILFLS